MLTDLFIIKLYFPRNLSFFLLKTDACDSNPDKCKGCIAKLPNDREICYCSEGYELTANRKGCKRKSKLN